VYRAAWRVSNRRYETQPELGRELNRDFTRVEPSPTRLRHRLMIVAVASRTGLGNAGHEETAFSELDVEHAEQDTEPLPILLTDGLQNQGTSDPIALFRTKAERQAQRTQSDRG